VKGRTALGDIQAADWPVTFGKASLLAGTAAKTAQQGGQQL